MITSVRDYATNHPNANYNDIVSRFGEPHQIATACVEDMDAPELLQNMKIRKKIISIIAATAMIIVLLWGYVVFRALANYYNSFNGYIKSYVEVVDRIPANEE